MENEKTPLGIYLALKNHPNANNPFFVATELKRADSMVMEEAKTYSPATLVSLFLLRLRYTSNPPGDELIFALEQRILETLDQMKPSEIIKLLNCYSLAFDNAASFEILRSLENQALKAVPRFNLSNFADCIAALQRFRCFRPSHALLSALEDRMKSILTKEDKNAIFKQFH